MEKSLNIKIIKNIWKDYRKNVRRKNRMETNIISVKYEDKYIPKTFGGKSYSYLTAVNVKIGDLVIAPTANGN